MKQIITAAVAALMLLGTITGVTNPKNTTSAAVLADGGAMPACYPSDSDCTPPVPPKK